MRRGSSDITRQSLQGFFPDFSCGFVGRPGVAGFLLPVAFSATLGLINVNVSPNVIPFNGVLLPEEQPVVSSREFILTSRTIGPPLGERRKPFHIGQVV